MLLFITFLSISKLLIFQLLRISFSLCISVCASITIVSELNYELSIYCQTFSYKDTHSWQIVCLKLHSVFLHPNYYFKCSSEGFQLLLVTIHQYCYKMSILLSLSVFTLQLHIPSFHSNTFPSFKINKFVFVKKYATQL